MKKLFHTVSHSHSFLFIYSCFIMQQLPSFHGTIRWPDTTCKSFQLHVLLPRFDRKRGFGYSHTLYFALGMVEMNLQMLMIKWIQVLRCSPFLSCSLTWSNFCHTTVPKRLVWNFENLSRDIE